MNRFRKLWGWCPYPKKPISQTKLPRPALVCVFLEAVLIVSLFALVNFSNVPVQSVSQIQFLANGALIISNATAPPPSSIPAINAITPASNFAVTISNTTTQSTYIPTEGLQIRYVGTYREDDTEGNINVTAVNFGNTGLHIKSINFYIGNELVWSQNVSAFIPANSATTINAFLPLVPQTSIAQSSSKAGSQHLGLLKVETIEGTNAIVNPFFAI